MRKEINNSISLLQLNNVTKKYVNDETICPVDNVSLYVNYGDFISVEGPSGIGKSTLLYLIGGLLKPNSGDILIEGQNILLLKEKELAALRSNKIGFIFQEPGLFQALTVEENLAFVLNFSNRYRKPKLNKSKIKELVEFYLKKLGIEERRTYFPYQLSGGQKRRLTIACALITEPTILLADEPTNDLDDYWANEIIGLFKEANDKGTATIMVTHNLSWSKNTDKRYKIEHGKLISAEN